jgi:PAS domain S-box-containing protein
MRWNPFKTGTMAKADKLREKAEAFTKRKGKRHYPLSEADMLKLIHELEVHQIELEMQHEEILQTRDEAKVSAEKYIGLYESAPIGLFTLSRDGTILNCNRYAMQMLGKEESELENTSFKDKVSKETIPEFNKFLQKVFESTNTKQECEISVITGDQELYLALTGISTQNRDDCLLTVEDVTEKKRSAEILIKNQRLSAIGEMAASIAHDLNNSLQIILGNVDLALNEKSVSDNLLKYLKIINNVINDVTVRVRHLQRFGGKNIERKTYEPVNMNILIEEVILQMRPLWKDDAEIKGLTFQIKTDYKDLSEIYGNDGELRMVLYNIINNSIEAMPGGGEITISTNSVAEGAAVAISDTGIGMNEATRTRLFQPFYSTKGMDIGRGLGMSGVLSIIKEHKGNIYIKSSEPGKGTTIELILPYMEKTTSEAKTHGKQVKTSKEAKKSLKILWVDDENSIRYVASEMLKILGHKSDTVASGQSALQLLDTNNYDLVITDLGMPEMNGWQLADAIKKKCNGNMKIAVISGWGDQISESEKEKHAVHFVINKPFSMLQLENLLTKIQ